jgi:hypothetical protein
MGADIALFGGGFFYDSQDAELEAFRNGSLVATSIDMMKVCLGTRGVAAHAVRSVSEIHAILGAITTKISRLRLVGHSEGASMGFAGKLGGVVDLVEWKPAAGIDTDILERSRKFLQEAVKGKLEDDAVVIAYGCHSGQRPFRGAEDLLQALANTFGVPARGFLRAIETCVAVELVPEVERQAAEKAGQKDMVSTYGRITSRGWFRVVDGRRFRRNVKCSDQGFVQSLDGLKPDARARPLSPQPR